ncbi:anaerobic ribonucleoside-triphosphate reductase, partial [Candidatus Bathyarchaeota archaeon]|nr:anaerobic ribonucleoside-triphosphate reductase [Candidatus Bathyarchaeota archaeon]
PVYDVQSLVVKRGFEALEEAGKNVLEEYMLLHILPRDVADAHLSGRLHLHDLSHWLLKPSEVIHDLRLFLTYGLKLENVSFSRHSLPPPKSFSAALNLISNAVFYTAEEVSRGQTLEFFNVFLAPFIKGLDVNEIRAALKLFILGLSRFPRISINLELSVPDFLAEKPVLGLSESQPNNYGDYADESLHLASILLDVYDEIVRSKPLTNPSITVKLRHKALSNSIFDEALIKAHQLAIGKTGVYFANLLKEDDAQATYSPSGCRLRTDLNGDWETDTLRISVLGKVTVNLPRISIECEGDEEDFRRILEARLDMAFRALEIKYRWFRSKAKNLLPFLTHNVNGDQYLRTTASAMMVNLAGLREAAEVIYGKRLYDDDNALNFAVKTSEFISELLSAFTKRRERRLYASALPSPVGSRRLAQLDIDIYGVSKVHFSGTRRQPYYSTSAKIDINDEQCSKMIMAEKEICRFLRGGTLIKVPFEGVPPKPEELIYITRKLVGTYQVDLFTYVWKVTCCRQCGKSWPKLLHKCPSCGAVNPLTVFAWNP